MSDRSTHPIHHPLTTGRAAFTVLEIIVVLMIVFLMMTLLVGAFVQHQRRKSHPVQETKLKQVQLLDPSNPVPVATPSPKQSATPAPATPAPAKPALRGGVSSVPDDAPPAVALPEPK